MRGFFFGLDLTDYDAERMPETPVVLTSALRRLLPRHMSMFWLCGRSSARRRACAPCSGYSLITWWPVTHFVILSSECYSPRQTTGR